MVAVTPCELIAIDRRHFDSLNQHGRVTLSVEAKHKILESISIFKSWDTYKLYRLAFTAHQREISKGFTILKEGEVSPALTLIVSGSVYMTKQPRRKMTKGAGGAPGNTRESAEMLTTLQAREYFGESGLLSFVRHQKQGGSRKAERELSNAIAASHMEVLEIKPEHYKMFDARTIEDVQNNRINRRRLRKERFRHVKTARKKMAMGLTSSNLGSDPPRPSSSSHTLPREPMSYVANPATRDKEPSFVPPSFEHSVCETSYLDLPGHWFQEKWTRPGTSHAHK